VSWFQPLSKRTTFFTLVTQNTPTTFLSLSSPAHLPFPQALKFTLKTKIKTTHVYLYKAPQPVMVRSSRSSIEIFVPFKADTLHLHSNSLSRLLFSSSEMLREANCCSNIRRLHNKLYNTKCCQQSHASLR